MRLKMDEVERAREFFRTLEDSGVGAADEIAWRAFCIQDRLG